jgi:predicted lipoprotein
MADDAIVAAIKEIASVLSGVAGITQAPQFPTEGVNDPPFIITKHIAADVDYSATYSRTISEVWADVYLARAVLPHAEENALPFVYSVMAAMAAELTLNTKASHCVLVRVEGPQGMAYQQEQYYGVRCIFELKIHHESTLTVTA